MLVELSFGSGGASQQVKMRCSGCKRPISADALGLGSATPNSTVSAAAELAAPARSSPALPRKTPGELRCPACGSAKIDIERTTAQGNHRIRCQACGKPGTIRGAHSKTPERVVQSPQPPFAAAPLAAAPLALEQAAPAYAASDWSAPVLDAAGPDIYRRNAFRITGLSTAASGREVAQQGRKLEMSAKLGVASAASVGLLPLEPAPAAEALHDALRRLHDPERRLFEELFWFWTPGAGGADEGLEALRRGDPDAARARWQERADDPVAVHDLAVLEHALALDLEAVPQPSAEQRQRRTEAWGRALGDWATVCESEPIWERLRDRAKELDDPRLDSSALARIRTTLPVALSLISARLGVAAAEAGHRLEAEAHRQRIETAGFEPRAIPEALRRATEPVADRVRTLCQAAEPEAEAAPEHGDRVTRRLLDQTRPLLAVIDAMLPKDHATRIAVHDEVALRVLGCQIPYGNKTKDWKGSEALLEQAIAVVASTSARTRILENLEIVRNNLSYGRCWFCSTAAAEEAAACEVKMHGEVTRTPVFNGVQVRWRTLTVSVPRCEPCKGVHEREAMIIGVATLVALVTGIGSCVAQDASGAGLGSALLIFVVVGLATAALVTRLRGPIRDADVAAAFPAVKEKLGQGWAMGERPAE